MMYVNEFITRARHRCRRKENAPFGNKSMFKWMFSSRLYANIGWCLIRKRDDNNKTYVKRPHSAMCDAMCVVQLTNDQFFISSVKWILIVAFDFKTRGKPCEYTQRTIYTWITIGSASGRACVFAYTHAIAWWMFARSRSPRAKEGCNLHMFDGLTGWETNAHALVFDSLSFLPPRRLL